MNAANPQVLRRVYSDICKTVVENGRVAKPRGYVTHEILGAAMAFKDLHKAMPIGTGRDLLPAIGAAEALLLVGGVSSPELLCNVSKQFRRFLDGGVFHGAYGPRVRPQLKRAVERLSDDPESRQAFVSIWDGLYDADDTRDLPCTVSFNFHIRDNKLVMHSHMRSQDVFLGLPYDIWFFGQLGMTVARVLGLDHESTILYHHVDSLHAYERNFDAIDRLHPYDKDKVTPQEDVLLDHARGFGHPRESIRSAMSRARAIHDRKELPDESRSEAWYRTILDPYDRLTAATNFTS